MNSESKSVIQIIIEILKIFFSAHNIPESHGFVHALDVLDEARQALEYESLSDMDTMCVMLAALLHDVDDRKYFKRSIDYANARNIMSELQDDIVEKVIGMIKLVSFSANGNNTEGIPRWMLIPRYADRLRAIGKEGIRRCLEYTIEVGRPLYRDETPRFTNVEEMIEATKARAVEYVQKKGDVGESSFIDHFYDKLIHLGLETGNEYIDKMSAAHMQVMFDVCLEFGEKGYITKSDIEKYID